MKKDPLNKKNSCKSTEISHKSTQVSLRIDFSRSWSKSEWFLLEKWFSAKMVSQKNSLSLCVSYFLT